MPMRLFAIRLSTVAIALSMIFQSAFLNLASKNEAEQLLRRNKAPRLESAYTVTGGKRTLRITLDQPVYITEENPSDYIFVTDEASGECIHLSSLPDSFAPVSPQKYGDREYTMAFDLFFEKDLPQVGTLNISTSNANNNDSAESVSIIQGISGKTLEVDVRTQKNLRGL